MKTILIYSGHTGQALHRPFRRKNPLKLETTLEIYEKMNDLATDYGLINCSIDGKVAFTCMSDGKTWEAKRVEPEGYAREALFQF